MPAEKVESAVTICQRRPCSSLFPQLAIDVVIWCLACLPVLGFFVWGKPFIQGFYCDDRSLAFPYRPSTVSTPVLLVGGLAIPLTLLVVTESVAVWRGSGSDRGQNGGRLSVSMGLKTYGVFLFGAILSKVFTELLKYHVGRLRPNFFAVCRPDWSSLNCSQGYITEYRCTNTEMDEREIRDSRLSFPSGHASFAMYCSLYTVFYMQERFHVQISYLLKPAIQSALILLATWCGVTRLPDNKHFATDVIAGFALGLATAWFTYTFVARPALAESEEEEAGSGEAFESYSPSSDPETPTPLLHRDHVITFNQDKVGLPAMNGSAHRPSLKIIESP